MPGSTLIPSTRRATSMRRNQIYTASGTSVPSALPWAKTNKNKTAQRKAPEKCAGNGGRYARASR
jgi:hypothetical protein